MFIIADSGSTKTDWVLINEKYNEVDRIRSIGLNPYFHTTEFIINELSNSLKNILSFKHEITKFFFYGSGCSSQDKNKIVHDALESHFPSAKINIEHDLIGAARASLGDQNGITCILGTGSNSCVWENGNVIENIPSHGYVLGDEGSGSYFGIRILKMYLEGRMDLSLIHI